MRAFCLGFLLLISACKNAEGREERYGSGYADGYAEGYNSQCKIRATLVEGDWDNSDYARGYADGRSQAIAACINKND